MPAARPLVFNTSVTDCLCDKAKSAVTIDAVDAAGLKAAGKADARLARWADAAGFAGKAGQLLLVPGDDGGLGRVLFGLGNEPDAFLPGKLATSLPAGTYRLGDGFADPRMATLAFCLGSYRFERYAKGKGEAPRLVCPQGVDREEVARIARGAALARDLVNTPANDMGPQELEDAACALAATHKARVKVISGDALLKANLPMIHAVGRASTRAPRLIDLTWGKASAPRVTLVGKGVVFDTGGLDLKPSSNMRLMKKDMGGAANVLGLAHMVMDANLPVRLRVLIPAVENAVAGDAFRPGDILPSRKGLTVEIGNTDAEGRLVLADALALADEETPDLIVDLATLTGAARVALGPDVPPVYSRDQALCDELVSAGEAENDPLWQLPLHTPYRKMLDSKVADICNVSSGGFAGSITAALFLEKFVDQAACWLHGDIFAWRPSAEPGRPEGGEAQAIRALYSVLATRYASKG
ncbi:MAG: leucyl aminopeptidase family protein [Rhodobiaceae bacterium]|nr:leucyl aminopeptidase family protein [Rhodobiaceae bacterium]MCC0017145.1 leucyl aminopeptidase family protein [Rhodobiaceae bacterium]MCC0041921.1 leucyl aminopeptidase family protein [Rhodobiaceae bacterium]